MDGHLALLKPGGEFRLVVYEDGGLPAFAAVGTEQIAQAWGAARAQNPGLYDGPLLSVEGIDLEHGTIECRRGRYSELVAQTTLAKAFGAWCLGVAQLSVTGLIVGRDWEGGRHVAIGRRSDKTRIYPGLWELAPSGGVELADVGAGGGLAVLTRALDAEAREELGMELEMGGAKGVAVVADPDAGSVDVIVRVELPGKMVPHRAPSGGACGSCMWEYTDTAWLSERDAMKFVREHDGAIIPPARAAMGRLGELLG